MAKAKKADNLTLEERLEQALVPEAEQPYPVPGNWCWTKVVAINKYRGTSINPIQSPNSTFELYSVPSSAENFPEIVYGSEIGSTKQLVEKNDILLCKINPRINRVWKVSKHTENILLASSEWIIIRAPQISPDYLMWCYQSKYFREFMLSNVSGVGGSLMRAQPKYVQNYPIPLPPLAEQQRIVGRIESLFSKLDEVKEKVQVALDSFETRRAAILHKAFTGELTTKWRRENNVDIETWKKFELRQVCTVNPKKANTKDLPDSLDVSFFPMASLSEIHGAIVAPQKRKLKDVRTGFTNFSEGDVVFAKITPCMENGKSAIIGKLINDIGYGSTEFFVLRCEKEFYNRYLYYIVRNRTFRDKAQAVMIGAVGQQRVPKDFMETYPLYLPPLVEQTEIVRILDDFFAKEQKAKELCSILDNIDLIKKSILARAFRGELGTNDPTEESAVELLKSIL